MSSLNFLAMEMSKQYSSSSSGAFWGPLAVNLTVSVRDHKWTQLSLKITWKIFRSPSLYKYEVRVISQSFPSSDWPQQKPQDICPCRSCTITSVCIEMFEMFQVEKWQVSAILEWRGRASQLCVQSATENSCSGPLEYSWITVTPRQDILQKLIFN